MVFPLIAALIGGAASLAGAGMAAGASRDASNTNFAINMYNKRKDDQARYEDQQQIEKQRLYAEELRKEGKLGGIDAQGNKTYFKEGVGWVSELGDRAKELQDYFYSQELPEQRQKFGRDAKRSRTNDDKASALLNEFNRVQRGSTKDAESMLLEKSTRGISESTASALETALRAALRSGTSNTDKISGAISRQAMDARGNAAKDAALQAEDYVDSKYTAERSGLAQLYNMFVQQAGQELGASSDPNAANQAANGMLDSFAGKATQGNQLGYSAAGRTNDRSFGKYDYIEPDMGGANALIGSGATIASLGDRMGSYTDQAKNNALLQAYLTSGGQFDLNKGGIFGAVSDRVRPSAGLF